MRKGRGASSCSAFPRLQARPPRPQPLSHRGERGVRRHRWCLAASAASGRAAARSSPLPSWERGRGEGAQLLILDEPTAALDPPSEYDAYLRFHELTRGRSTLLISHRFSTVKMADRIVVLEHGRIAEEGTHAELLALGGTYADLYEKQAARCR
ncbi:MAG: hypothetical protein HY332_10745 [Chloroflexi bacterium]|nr:hypothetical protein [Chloroflexota bacterium]